MAELITLAIDIALGALAYRLAYENRAAIKETREDIELLKQAFKQLGVDLDSLRR